MIALCAVPESESRPTTEREMHLRDVGAGEKVIVAGVAVSQNEAKRLADMGFVTGVRVEMVRTGEPCIVRLNGTLVGLGVANQRVIRVVTCA